MSRVHFFGQMGLGNGLARSKSQPFHIILEDFDSYGKITSKSGLLGHSEELIRRVSDFFGLKTDIFAATPCTREHKTHQASLISASQK